MLLSDTISSALKAMTINPVRSLLTMLGIIIGVGSVVLMSSIGTSMQGVILGQISSLGAKSMVIFPGQVESGPPAISTGRDSLTFEDLLKLEQLPSITHLAPVIFISGTTQFRSEEGSPQVFGVRENFFKNQNIAAAEGRLLDQGDDDGARSVALIAPDVKDTFFGQADPLGKRLKVGNNHYTVVGVTKPLGSQFFQNADNRVYVPFSVARNVTGQKYLNYITMEATGNFDLAFDSVKDLLRDRHGINNPTDDQTKDDFVVRSSEQANQILGAVSLGLTAFITTIATISLLVGGIGIMNIMLVSVTERTQEIGLRKAIGARQRDILLQFLTESVLLTLIGGIIGMMLGIGFSWLAAFAVTPFLATYHFTVSLGSVIASLVMAALAGIVFGISPARKAAKLHPMEALRYE